MQDIKALKNKTFNVLLKTDRIIPPIDNTQLDHGLSTFTRNLLGLTADIYDDRALVWVSTDFDHDAINRATPKHLSPTDTGGTLKPNFGV